MYNSLTTVGKWVSKAILGNVLGNGKNEVINEEQIKAVAYAQEFYPYLSKLESALRDKIVIYGWTGD